METFWNGQVIFISLLEDEIEVEDTCNQVD